MLVKCQSWGPSNDGGLRMVNWELQSKTPPQSPEDEHIYCILLIRVAFCHVSENLPFCCMFYDTMSIYFCFKTARDVVTVLLIFAIFITLPTHFHMHTQRHTHTSTHVLSAHKRNGDNQAQEPG